MKSEYYLLTDENEMEHMSELHRVSAELERISKRKAKDVKYTKGFLKRLLRITAETISGKIVDIDDVICLSDALSDTKKISSWNAKRIIYSVVSKKDKESINELKKFRNTLIGIENKPIKHIKQIKSIVNKREERLMMVERGKQRILISQDTIVLSQI